MKQYTVPPGVSGHLIRDAKLPGEEPPRMDLVTRNQTVFSEDEVVVDPDARVASSRHAPWSATEGGEWARKGYIGFHRAGMVLLVPRKSVVESESES